MSSLALRLHRQSLATSMGAVASLQQVANDRGQAITTGRRIEVAIPANSGGDNLRVIVEPGRWLIEATLPSGEVVTEEVAVANGEDVPVSLHSVEESSHEWLGLQHLVGNIEGAETLRQIRDDKLEGTRRISLEAAVPSINGDSAVRRRRASFELPTVQTSEKPDILHAEEAWANFLSPDPVAVSPCPATWQDPDEETWLYEIPGTAQRRQFGHVNWLGERFAVSLPLPWQAIGNYQLVPAQVMVRMEPRQDDIRIGVLVEDPDFAAMAGLMSASTLPKAVVAVRQARDMLFEKMTNPLGAAAGGYVLLAAGDREDQEWHHWIDNLAGWFPDIPDGAILKASLKLRFPKDKSSGEEARASLLEAFNRGVPYYSAGVSWLLDGLTVFADDPAVEKKMKIVHRLALRLDLSQAFTVIRVSGRANR